MSVRQGESRLEVRAPGGECYSVLTGRALLDSLGGLVAEMQLGRRVVVASDTNVLPLYGERVAAALRGAGFEVEAAAMPAGEAHKTWDSVSLFINACVRAGLDRGGWVAALGGGVVGDTAGLAAALYMRGVRLVQLPTTLLAMADSSVGGKVGVDLPAGKNLLGAFKQPDLVVADLDTLATLPPLQISCGMAEIIKAGVIADPELSDMVGAAGPSQLDFGGAVLRAVRVKRDIVERDPYEAGERALLNLGHTFGHALESCSGYTRPHGVAVAQGMALAFRLAVRLGMCDPAGEARLLSMLQLWDLPSRWGELGLSGAGEAGRVYAAMLGDKKRRDGRLRLVLPEAIGRVRVVEGVERETVVSVLEELQ